MNVRGWFPSCAYGLLLAAVSSGAASDVVISGMATPPSGQILIAPHYSQAIYFMVRNKTVEETSVRGRVAGFVSGTLVDEETYRQRSAGMDGKFHVIHVEGDSVETVTRDGHASTTRKSFKDAGKFDDLGFFDTGASDPVDLIPLYAGHPVALGESWYPQAQVKADVGSGRAHYTFHVDRIERGADGNTLAWVSFSFYSDLTPAPALAGGLATISGDGWLVWDCTVNQRRETHIHATYAAYRGEDGVRRIVTFDDALQSHPGHLDF